MNFSHVTADAGPTMVDVGDKPVPRRTAVAESRVELPGAVAAALRANSLKSPTGTSFLAIATKLASRASEASRS